MKRATSAMTGLANEVLIVEDDDELRRELVELLSMFACNAVPAANGRRAMELLAEGHRPALMLLDLNMPVMSGFEVLVSMAADPVLREIPIAVMTALDIAGSEIPVPHRDAGIIRKPFIVTELVQLVKDHCEGRR